MKMIRGVVGEKVELCRISKVELEMNLSKGSKGEGRIV